MRYEWNLSEIVKFCQNCCRPPCKPPYPPPYRPQCPPPCQQLCRPPPCHLDALCLNDVKKKLHYWFLMASLTWLMVTSPQSCCGFNRAIPCPCQGAGFLYLITYWSDWTWWPLRRKSRHLLVITDAHCVDNVMSTWVHCTDLQRPRFCFVDNPSLNLLWINGGKYKVIERSGAAIWVVTQCEYSGKGKVGPLSKFRCTRFIYKFTLVVMLEQRYNLSLSFQKRNYWQTIMMIHANIVIASMATAITIITTSSTKSSSSSSSIAASTWGRTTFGDTQRRRPCTLRPTMSPEKPQSPSAKSSL